MFGELTYADAPYASSRLITSNTPVTPGTSNFCGQVITSPVLSGIITCRPTLFSPILISPSLRGPIQIDPC